MCREVWCVSAGEWYMYAGDSYMCPGIGWYMFAERIGTCLQWGSGRCMQNGLMPMCREDWYVCAGGSVTCMRD